MVTTQKRAWRPQQKALVALVAACFALPEVYANPTGAKVVNGQATFATQGNTLSITNTPGAVIHWQGFSINANETTKFIQQSAQSSVLNRVVTADPSVILGTLQSNGRVFLINPAGILVGQGAKLDVGAFVGSTLNITNADFAAGKLNFQNTPGAGNVINQGSIATPVGGYVYLVGTNVKNEGIIKTPQGETILAAGNSVQLIDSGTPGVRVEVSASNNKAENLGSIIAESGRVGIVGAVVRNKGVINANQVVKGPDGRIFLKSTKATTVEQGSKISADGDKGGKLEVSAQQGDVRIETGSSLTAIGYQGTGGSINLQSAQGSVVVEPGAVVDASGVSGGNVSAIANQGQLHVGGTMAASATRGGITPTARTPLVLVNFAKINATPTPSETEVLLVATLDNHLPADGIAGQGGNVQLSGLLITAPTSLVDVAGDSGGRIGVNARGELVIGEAATLNASGGQGGQVYIESAEGKTLVSGNILARGDRDNGGTARLLGEKVALFGRGRIDVSGKTGGGEALVGGDYQGKNVDVRNAEFTFVGNEASISADAIEQGDGGKVIIWANDATRTYGSISARGGATGGDGGFAETSGKRYLDVGNSLPDLVSPTGKGGTWLLDPNNITIMVTADSNISAGPTFTSTDNSSILSPSSIQSQLHGGVSVIVQTGTGGTSAEVGDITVAANISKTSGTAASLTLRAHNSIIVNSSVIISSTSGAMDIVLNADHDANGLGAIVMNSGSSLLSNGGNITLGGGANPATTAARGTAANNEGVKLSGATLTASGGNIVIRGTGQTAAATNNSYGVVIEGSSAVTTLGGGTITINGVGGGTGASSNQRGVVISGNNTLVRAVDANVSITGSGGTGAAGLNYGVYVDGASGVNGAIVETTGNGGVSITGTGGTGAGGNEHYGLYAANKALIRATGGTGSGGSVALTGTGGAGTNSNYGVYLSGSTTALSSANGAITINGTGGAGTGSDNYGVYVNAASVTQSGAANLTITGSSASTSAANGHIGILVSNGATLSHSGASGTLLMTGTGGGGGAGSFNHGIEVYLNNTTVATSSASLTLNGTGGSGSAGTNIGVRINGNNGVSGAVVQTTGTGAVSITGIAGAGNSDGILLTQKGVVRGSGSTGSIDLIGVAAGSGIGINTSSSGNAIGGGTNAGPILLDSNTMALNNASIETTSIVAIVPSASSQPVNIGGGAPTGGLDIDQTEISNITASGVTFGSGSQIGDITIANADFSAGNKNFTATQSLAGGGKIQLDDAGVPNAALRTGAGNISLTAGTSGIRSTNGTSSNGNPEIGTTGTVTLITTGALGQNNATASLIERIQFSSASVPSSIVAGTGTDKPSFAGLQGFSTLTLGDIQANGNINILGKDGLTLAGNVSNGAGTTTSTFFNADSDANGTGMFTLNAAKSITTASTNRVFDASGNTSGTHAVLIKGADVDLQGTIVVPADADVSLRPSQAGTAIRVGSATAGTFHISNAEIGNIGVSTGGTTLGGVIRIGSNTSVTADPINSGAIVVAGVTAPGKKIGLISGSTIDDEGAGTAIQASGVGFNSLAAIGGASGGSDGFTLDVGSVRISETGGTNATITDTGVSNSTTTFRRATTGGAGNISFTKSTGNLDLSPNAGFTGDTVSTTGNVTLSATNGALSQGAGTSIVANTLTTASSGGTTLTQANVVSNFAASNIGSGGISFVNNGSYMVTGISQTAVGNVTLNAQSGNLSLNGAVSAGANTVRLQANTGSVTQTGSGVITAGTLGVNAGTSISLAATNAVTPGGSFAATAGSGNLSFINTSGVNIDAVAADGASFAAQNGLSAVGNAIVLSAGAGTFTQTAGKNIAATGLELNGAGAYNLNSSGNAIVNLAATSGAGSLAFVNSGTLNVGTVGATNGVTRTGTVSLSAGGSVGQTQVITASSLTTNSVGGTLLNGSNAVSGSFSGTNTISGNIGFTNGVGAPNTLTVSGSNTAVGGQFNIQETSGDLAVGGGGVTTAGGQIVLRAFKSGGLATIASNVSAIGSGQGAGAIVDVRADDIAISGSINAGTANNVTLGGNDATRIINIGTNQVGELGLTDGELDLITAQGVNIGRSGYTGQIKITAPVNPANAGNVQVQNNAGGIAIGANLTANNSLVVQADVGGPTGAITRTSGILTASSGSVTLNAAMGIGTLGSPIEVQVGAGTVNATNTLSGNLSLRQASGNLVTSKYTLSAPIAAQAVKLSTVNGSITTDNVSGFAGIADDHLTLETGGAAQNINLNGGTTINASSLTLAATGSGNAIVSSGTVTLNAATTFQSPLGLEVVGGTLNGSGNLALSTFTQSGGVINGFSGLTANTSFAQTGGAINGGAFKLVTNGSFNQGTLAAINVTSLELGGASVVNLAGANGIGTLAAAMSGTPHLLVNNSAPLTVGTAGLTTGISGVNNLSLSAPSMTVSAPVGAAGYAIYAADALSLGGSTTAGTFVVLETKSTAGVQIALGGVDGAGVLGLNTSDLATITAPRLNVGGLNAIPVMVSTPISVATPILAISSGATGGPAVSQAPGASITVAGGTGLLAVFGQGGVNLPEANQVGTITGSTGSGGTAFVFNNTGNLNIGSLASFSDGVSAQNGGAVNIATTGNLTVLNGTAVADVNGNGAGLGSVLLQAKGGGTLTVISGAQVQGGAAGGVSLSGDDIDLQGTVNAGTALAALKSDSVARNVNIELSHSAGVLSLTPAELQNITSGTLEIGRIDSTGTLSVSTLVNDAHVNATTLRLIGGNVNTFGGALGVGGGTLFNRHVDMWANNDAYPGAIFLGDNRNLNVLADRDNNLSGNAILSGHTTVGTATNSTGSMNVQAENIQFLANGGVSAFISVMGAGAQNFTARNAITMDNTGTGTLQATTGTGLQTLTTTVGDLTVLGSNAGSGTGLSGFAAGGAQNITLGGGLSMQSRAGGAATADAAVSANGVQTISAKFVEASGAGAGDAAVFTNAGASSQTINTTGHNGANLAVRVVNQGTGQAYLHGGGTGGQTITVAGAKDVLISGAGGTARISAFSGDQTLSGVGTLTVGNGGNTSTSLLQGTGAQQTVNAGSLLVIGGAGVSSAASIQASNAQTVSITGAATIQGGTGTGALGASGTATVQNSGAGLQSFTSGSLTLTGGASGTNNDAQVGAFGTGAQTVSANTISLTGGNGTTNNRARILLSNATSNATQTVNAGAGGITLIGGGSTLATDNFNLAGIVLNGATAGTSVQSVAIANGHLTLTSGSVGTSHTAVVSNATGPTQTISTGSGNISLTAGASGTDNGVALRVSATGGTQNITTNAISMSGGASTGTNAGSGIFADNQTLVATGGNVTLNAGTGSGARIGGLTNANVNVTANVGDIVLTANGANGAAIGSNNTGTYNNTLNVTALTGNVTLNPGTGTGVRIGAPTGLVGAGNISVVAGGNITLNSNGSFGGAIRTTGNVVLGNASTDAIAGGSSSLIQANTLTTQSSAGTSLNGANNAVNALTANNAGTGNISFANSIPMTLGAGSTLSNSAPAGGIAVTVLGATNDLTVAGTISGSGAVDLTAGRDVLFTQVAVPGVSTTGAVTLTATAGAIQGSPSSNMDVQAGSLTANAATGIGTAGFFEVNVGTLAAQSTAGNIKFLANSPALNVGTLTGNALVTVENTGGSIHLASGASAAARLEIEAYGDITQGGAINTPILMAVTHDNAGSDITLTNPANQIGAGQLGTIQTTGTLAAPGVISLTTATPFVVGFAGATPAIGMGTSGSVTLNVGGALTQILPIQSPSLSVTSSGTVTLTDAGNTVGNLALNANGAASIVSAAAGLNIAGATTNGAALTLNAPQITQNAPIVNTGIVTANATNQLMLSDAGNTFSQISASSTTGNVTLATNTATLGVTGLSAPLGNADIANHGGALNLAATTNVGGNLQLLAHGGISQSAPINVGGVLEITALGGHVILNNISNSFSNLTLSNSGTGAATFATGGALTVLAGGIDNQGGNVSLDALGTLTINGPINAGTHTLELLADGAISQTAPMFAQKLVAATYNNAGAAITLDNPGNVVSGVDLQTLDGAGVARVNANIDFKSTVGFEVGASGNGISTLGVASLLSGGAITQSMPIRAFGVGVNSVGGVALDNPNNVTQGLFVENTGGGAVLFNNTTPTLNVAGVTNSGAGNITLANNGAINVTGSLGADGGNVLVTAIGQLNTTAGVYASGDLGLYSLGMNQGGGISAGGIINLHASNGALVINAPVEASGAQVNLFGGNMSLNAAVNNPSGTVVLNNMSGGAVTVGLGQAGFGLSNAELNNIYAANLIFNASPVTVDGPVNLTSVGTLALNATSVAVNNNFATTGGLNVNTSGLVSVNAGTSAVTLRASSMNISAGSVAVNGGSVAGASASLVTTNGNMSIKLPAGGTMSFTPGLGGARLTSAGSFGLAVGGALVNLIGGACANCTGAITATPLLLPVATDVVTSSATNVAEQTQSTLLTAVNPLTTATTPTDTSSKVADSTAKPNTANTILFGTTPTAGATPTATLAGGTVGGTTGSFGDSSSTTGSTAGGAASGSGSTSSGTSGGGSTSGSASSSGSGSGSSGSQSASTSDSKEGAAKQDDKKDDGKKETASAVKKDDKPKSSKSLPVCS